MALKNRDGKGLERFMGKGLFGGELLRELFLLCGVRRNIFAVGSKV